MLPVDQQCAWFGGITADQTERALLYLKGHRLMVEGLLLAKQMPGCADLLDGPDASHLEIEDSRLRVFYVDPKRNSVWALLRRCADYGHVSDAGKRLRKCILAKPANQQACAAQLASPLFAPVAADLRGWLHLTDSCAANPAPVTWPRTKPDTDRRAEGTLNYSLGLPETTAAHKAAVRNLVATHHAVDHAYIHGGPAPAPGSVQRAVLAAMDAAPTEEWRHATIMEFTTLIDPAWAEDERKDWKRLEGLAMAFWGRGFEELPGEEVWKFLTPTRATHETIHRCAALKNGTKVAINDHVAELKRLGDLSATAKETQLSSQPRRTCAAWLACLRDRSCALPWVPADWRAM